MSFKALRDIIAVKDDNDDICTENASATGYSYNLIANEYERLRTARAAAGECNGFVDTDISSVKEFKAYELSLGNLPNLTCYSRVESTCSCNSRSNCTCNARCGINLDPWCGHCDCNGRTGCTCLSRCTCNTEKVYG